MLVLEEKIKSIFQRRYLLLLFLLFIFSFGIRIYRINAESAWIDEAYSIQLSVNSIHDIVIGTVNDQHPPLYYIFLKFWLENRNDVPFARLLSAIIGSINILQILFILREIKLFSFNMQLLTCILISFSPMHIWYSQEARMYVLLLFFTLASIQIFIKIINSYENQEQNKRDFNWIIFVILNILSIYTHYFSIFIIIFELIIYLIYINYKKFKFEKIIIGFVSFFGIILAFLPWIPVALNQLIYHKLLWIGTPTFSLFSISLNRLIFGPIVTIFPKELNLLIFLAILITYSLGSIKVIHDIKEKSIFTIFLILWTFIPLLMIYLISLKYPIFQFKQLILVLVPAILLFVLILKHNLKKIGVIIILCLMALNILSSIYQQTKLFKDDWRGLTIYIENQYKEGDVIFFNTSASVLGFSLYQKGDLPTTGYPLEYDVINGGWNGNILIYEDEAHILEKLKKSFSRIWYVEYYPDMWDPQRLIFSWLNENMNIKTESVFGSISLRLYN